jgi:hypothetical protein
MTKRFLSLGWGVQSFTLAAMIALGDLPMVDAAIHADTTHESEHTYTFASRWTQWLEDRGVRVVTVTPKTEKSGIVRPLADGSALSVAVPVYTRNERGTVRGQLSRQCTEDWKIKPIRTYIRSQIAKKETADLMLGISTDEVQRAKSSGVLYLEHVFPLLDLRMSRAGCVAFLEKSGLEVPPKSACHFCPFHSRGHWIAMKRENGSDWQNALAADEILRDARPGKDAHSLYIHTDARPLKDAVTIPEDFGLIQSGFDFEDASCDSGHCFM